jgi:hypothetical protein
MLGEADVPIQRDQFRTVFPSFAAPDAPKDRFIAQCI